MVINYLDGGRVECEEIEVMGDTVMIDHEIYVSAYDIKNIEDGDYNA